MLTEATRSQIHHAIIRLSSGSEWRVLRQHIRGEVQGEEPNIPLFRQFFLQELTDFVDNCIMEEKRVKEEGL